MPGPTSQNRVSFFNTGTLSEWVFGLSGGAVVLAGIIWGGATLFAELRTEIQESRFETAKAINDIAHSVSAITKSIESNQRITILERKDTISQMTSKLDANLSAINTRVDRNWKNVDRLWEVVRDNQGRIKAVQRDANRQ